MIKDSTHSKGKGGGYDTYYYTEKGTLLAYTGFNPIYQKIVTVAYDKKGNPIPDYVYKKPPEYPGGLTAWQRYLERNLNRDLPVEHGARAGKYTVIVDFLIDDKGKIIKIYPENNPGYGTKEEAVRVIEKSTDWLPAIEENKPVLYKHRQSITFVVSNQ